MATRSVETYENGKLVATRTETISDEQDNAERIANRLAQLIATLEDADARWAELTTAQKADAYRLAVVGVAKLARLVLNRLEAA